MNKVQEALKAAINFIESVHSGEWSGGDYSRVEILTIIESALADIDKCELVGIYKFEPDTVTYGVKWYIKEPLPNNTELFTTTFIKNSEPVAKLGRWMIDKSTGTDILTLDNCSVIEGKYAHYIMGLLQKEIDKVVSELENTSPISKEWVGLSENDIHNTADHTFEIVDDFDAVFKFYNAIEAKLKQLNVEKG